MYGVFTLLYNKQYLPGALLLGSVLKDLKFTTGFDANLGVLVDKAQFDEVQLSYLDKIYDDVIDVPVLKATLHDKLHHDLQRPELDKTFTKIHLWSLYDKYDKILYLDADTLPNLEGNGSVLDLLKLEFPPEKILAAPDSGFPDIFNSGVFVLKPNAQDFEALSQLAGSSGDVSFDGADQGLLNQYFNSKPDWVNEAVTLGEVDITKLTNASNWVPLPFLYNMTPSAQYEYVPAYNYFSSGPIYPYGKPEAGGLNDVGQASAQGALAAYSNSASKYYGGDQVKLIHFIGPFKPWNHAGAGGIHGKWWELWHKYFHGIDVADITQAKDELKYSTLDSLWDPSKSSPPRTHVVHDPVVIPQRALANHADEKPKGRKSKGEIQREREAEARFGFHWNQVAERSFEGVHDYIASLPVISRLKQKEDKIAREKGEATSDHTTQGEKPDDFSRAVSFAKVNERLEQLEIESNKK